MTSWTKTTGSTGLMKIDDTGSWVDFWFKAGYSSDWYNGLEFSYTVDGDTTHKTINYPTGADWYKIGTAKATYSQTVTFKLVTDTGIGGIGGPTTFTHSISRDSSPDAPGTPKISGIKATSVVVSFTDGDDNGDAIDARQIRYDNNSDASSSTTVSSDGSTTISGLSQNTTYYFWARTHNSYGWGPWSAKASAKTLSVPAAPSAPLLSSVTATSVDISWSDNSNGGSPIIGHQIGWTPNVAWPPESPRIVSASSPQVLSGLTPGTVYYIYVRAQNSSGWSEWSKPTQMRTVAGVYILVGTTWKLAVPYVNVGGTWKMAEAWGRSSGTWKRAS